MGHAQVVAAGRRPSCRGQAGFPPLAAEDSPPEREARPDPWEVAALARGEPGILKGLKTIEWLKAELLAAVGDLFRGMLRGAEDLMLDSLAHIVLSSYLLARRLGFGFTRLDLKIEDQVQAHLRAGHEVEQWYGDLSALLRHLRDGRREGRRPPVSGDTGGSS